MLNIDILIDNLATKKNKNIQIYLLQITFYHRLNNVHYEKHTG